MRSALSLLLLAACAETRAPEDWAPWYAAGEDYDVVEPVAFTDVPYTFPSAGADGVAQLPIPADFATTFGEGDEPPSGCDDWELTDELPVEVEGMVTVHPRFYFKAPGCLPPQEVDPDADSDEKFYGSYFIQDATGGIFVLGDSKVAHFDMGDRVKLRVRAMRNRFGLVAVAVHDVLEIVQGPEPIFYEIDTDGFGAEDVAKVKRVTGTVVSEPDTFGEFQIEAEDGTRWSIALDSELNRRGVWYPVGTRLEATGPVMFSFDVYSVVILRVGQITVLADDGT